METTEYVNLIAENSLSLPMHRGKTKAMLIQEIFNDPHILRSFDCPKCGKQDVSRINGLPAIGWEHICGQGCRYDPHSSPGIHVSSPCPVSS